jgi:hypothetical protein
LGWDFRSVTKEQKPDREKNQTIRSRQRAIGRELRRMFEDVAKEPVPEDFIALLHKMDEPEDNNGDDHS